MLNLVTFWAVAGHILAVDAQRRAYRRRRAIEQWKAAYDDIRGTA